MVDMGRLIKGPVNYKLDVVISESGITKVTCYKISEHDEPIGEKLHCYIDSTEPAPILNAIENHIDNGRWTSIISFFKEHGSKIMEPHIFRLKMDASLGVTSGDTCDDLF